MVELIAVVALSCFLSTCNAPESRKFPVVVVVSAVVVPVAADDDDDNDVDGYRLLLANEDDHGNLLDL